MKKFKHGDTIALKNDAVTHRTFEVSGAEFGVMYGLRNDVRASSLSMPFVLARPDQYKLLHRPTEKDREIERLRKLAEERDTERRQAEARAAVAQRAIDAQLLEGGLVRTELLRSVVLDGTFSGDSNGARRADLTINVRDSFIREVVDAIAN